MGDVFQTFLVAVVIAGYGSVVSFLQERFGRFQDLTASQKQLINSVLTLVVPYLVAFFQPYWKLEFGDEQQVLSSALLLIAPALVWLTSQLAHAVDKRL